MKKLFTLIFALVGFTGIANAETVDDLAVLKHSYVLVCDEYTNNGTEKIAQNAIYGDGFFFTPTGHYKANNKRSVNLADAVWGAEINEKYGGYGSHLNSMRIKNAQEVFAMKVTAKSKVIIFFNGQDITGSSARLPKIATNAGLSEGVQSEGRLVSYDKDLNFNFETTNLDPANFAADNSVGISKLEWTAPDDMTIYIGSYNGDTFISYVIVEEAPRTFAVSVSENAATGLTTMYVDYATEIPEGVEAWYVSAYDATKDKLTMTQIEDCVPANTAIIVKGEAGQSYDFVETFETVDAISGTNLLTGSVTDSEAQAYTTDDGWYYLATSGNFKKYEGTGIIRKAHKAYLYLSSEQRAWNPSSAKELTIDWGEPTGIKTIDNGQLTIDNSKAYNLNGVRVNENYKGIIIVNGKKYINK